MSDFNLASKETSLRIEYLDVNGANRVFELAGVDETAATDANCQALATAFLANASLFQDQPDMIKRVYLVKTTTSQADLALSVA